MKQTLNNLVWLGVMLSQLLLWSDVALSDDDDYIKVKVPKRLQAQGYYLRVDQQEIKLNKPVLRLLPTGYTQDLHLLAKDGRIVDQDHGPITSRMLKKMNPRRHRFGFTGGNAFVDRGSMANLLLPQKFTAMDLRYEYSMGRVIALLSLTDVSHVEAMPNGLKVDYDASGVRIGGGREIAPFSGAETSTLLKRLHFQGNAGLSLTSHLLTYKDLYNDITHKGHSVGGFLELQARFLMAANFWFSLRAAADFYQLKFEELDFDKGLFQTTTLWGVDYVF